MRKAIIFLPLFLLVALCSALKRPFFAPVAVIAASPDTLVTLPTSTVTLNGSGSTGTSLTYAWTKSSGPTGGAITSPTSVSTTITGLGTRGVYRYQLQVTDNTSATATASVAITVLPTNTYYYYERGILLYENGGFYKVGYNVKSAKNIRGQVLGYYNYSNDLFVDPAVTFTQYTITKK